MGIFIRTIHSLKAEAPQTPCTLSPMLQCTCIAESDTCDSLHAATVTVGQDNVGRAFITILDLVRE
jgi:hypothetical protein